MASNLFWFYDAFAVGILLIGLYCGAKRGLMRSVVLVALLIASVVLSWIISTVGAPVIYENFIEQRVLTSLKEASFKTDPLSIVSSAVRSGGYGVEMTDNEIEGVITQTGDFFQNIASEIKSNGASESEGAIGSGVEDTVTESMLRALVGDVVSPNTLREILESVSGAENSVRQTVDVFLNGDRTATASAVESKLVAPAVKFILKGIIWVVSMMILTLLAKSIANAFRGLNRVPIIGPVNSLLGAALGLAEGALMVYVISQIVKLIMYLTENSLMFLNADTVARTYAFKHFVYFNVMTLMGR